MKINFNTCSLISLHTNKFSFHLGVYPDEDELYKYKKGTGYYYVDIKHWMWGRYTEPYDLCLEYFGCGPLFMICW